MAYSSKDSAKKGDCSARNFFGAKEGETPCKVCDKCEKDAKPDCVLYPYNSDCCADKHDAHHALPVRCFIYSAQRKVPRDKQQRLVDKYNDKHAPCICLNEDDHKEAHKIQNKIEAAAGKSGNGRWSYDAAATCAAQTVVEVRGKGADGKPKCTEDCIREQLNAYHQSEEVGCTDSTQLRADPSGRMATSKAPTSTAATAAAALE